MNMVAQEKLQEVETLVSKLAEAEGQLEKGYAHLAFLLRDVSEQRYWMGVYDNFGDFLTHLSQRYNVGKSQLYNYLSTAKALGGEITEEQLNQMGISKALALRAAKEATGTISSAIVDRALDPKVTVKDLKKILFDAGSLTKPEPGDWIDLDFSCYVTEEERKEIQDACNAARHVDPPIDERQPQFLQRKEILLRFSREFLAAYPGDVIDGAEEV
jgi:hypothetical protein